MHGGATFDPWASTPEDALRAHEQHDPAGGAPDPLAQFQAAQEVLQAQDACLAAGGGCSVLRCVNLCLLNGLAAPRWLSDAFAQRHARVAGAEVGSWDEAFGRPWPARTRLDLERRRMLHTKAVHAAVWRMVAGRPSVSINRVLFDKVAAALDLGVSGSKVEKLYLAALADGYPNARQVRDAHRVHR